MGEYPFSTLLFWCQHQQRNADGNRRNNFVQLDMQINLSRRILEQNVLLIGANHRIILCRLLVVSEHMTPITHSSRMARRTVCNAVLQLMSALLVEICLLEGLTESMCKPQPRSPSSYSHMQVSFAKLCMPRSTRQRSGPGNYTIPQSKPKSPRALVGQRAW